MVTLETRHIPICGAVLQSTSDHVISSLLCVILLIKVARLPRPLVSSYAHGSEPFVFAKGESALLLPSPYHLLESFQGVSEYLREGLSYTVLQATLVIGLGSGARPFSLPCVLLFNPPKDPQRGRLWSVESGIGFNGAHWDSRIRFPLRRLLVMRRWLNPLTVVNGPSRMAY